MNNSEEGTGICGFCGAGLIFLDIVVAKWYFITA
jgi:hypothetical protein